MIRKVLVVEDSFEVRIALEMALSQEGYEVMACADGEAGWQGFLEYKPDLALLDIRMPGMGGIQLCRQIREASSVPVIIFSAIEDKAEKMEAFEAGADDYVVKGTGIDELLVRVAAQLRWTRKANAPDEERSAEVDDTKQEIWRDVGERKADNQRDVKAVLKTGNTKKNRSKPKSRLQLIKVPPFTGKLGSAVLVADPNAKDRDRIVRQVTRMGFPTIEVENGRQTLKAAGKYLPWLVITEIVMPDMAGSEMLKVLYEHPRTQHVATMVVSSIGSPDARARAYKFGTLDYIVKPWEEQELALRVEWAKQSHDRKVALSNHAA